MKSLLPANTGRFWVVFGLFVLAAIVCVLHAHLTQSQAPSLTDLALFLLGGYSLSAIQAPADEPPAGDDVDGKRHD